jgi:hypothetical protein
MHHTPEKRHRGPIYRVLPRFIGGLSPHPQRAITLPRCTAYEDNHGNNSMSCVQEFPDKSINRPSLAFVVHDGLRLKGQRHSI